MSNFAASDCHDSTEPKPFHVVLCTGKDIKGLIATNLADQFFTPKNIKLTVFLCDDAPKSEGAKLASQVFGPHEYGHWFGNSNASDEDLGYIGGLDANEEDGLEKRNVGEEQAFSTFQEIRDRGIQVTVLEKTINNSRYLDMLRSIEPDVIYSARFLHIFKAPILKIPTHGVLNMHPGALPGYKGLHVDMRAMMDQIENCTMTMHEVDTGIDTGKFINEFEVKIDPTTSLFWHRLQLQVGGMNMFFEVVMKMAGLASVSRESPSPEEKDRSGEGQYFTWPDSEEYRRFEEMGLKHVEAADILFIEGLFDKRLSCPVTIKQQPQGGLFLIGPK
jgi:folate-dependent phosphoribosylglycinamide formyltransferase PurN